MRLPIWAFFSIFLILPAAGFCAETPDISRQVEKLAAELVEGYRKARPEAKPQTIAVFPFNSSPELAKSGVGSAAASMMLPQLIRAKEFIVVERAELDRVLAEQKLSLTGAIDSNSAVKVGKLLGTQLLLLGNVDKVGNYYQISARLVEVESGKVIFSAFGEFLVKEFNAASPVPVERPDIKQDATGLLISGGIIARNHAVSWNTGIAVRSRSQRWEAGLDIAEFKRSRGGYHSNVASEVITESRRLTARYHQLKVFHIKPVQYLGIPGIYRIRLPGHLRIGAGLGLYRLSQFLLERNRSTSVESTQSHVIYVGSPVVELGLGVSITNALELQLRMQYAHDNGDAIAHIPYGGLSGTASFAYRIF